MCSTREARLASLRAAIDEVALAAQGDPGEHADLGELAARLAGIWAMIAELDPGLAARLRGYCPDMSLGSRARSAWERGRMPCSSTQPTVTGAVGPGARAPGWIQRATAKSAEGQRAWLAASSGPTW